jgi:mRNA-degrading endonuclease YafQ of YafQ-DinJ toxin-antitoxin module
MRSASCSAQFERDVERLQNRGKDIEKLKSFVKLLLAEIP